MKRSVVIISALATAWLSSLGARANPEPTAYDSRSIGLGLTGVSYLERPAALAINPANLEGIESFAVSGLFNPLIVLQSAPVEGANTKFDSGIGFGPMGSFFLAGRVAPRVVLGMGLYIETGYGSEFGDVGDVDGAGQNTSPEDLKVVFFVGEVAFGSSFKLSDKVNVGVALRVPFSKQIGDLYTNLGAALGGGIQYGRVKNDLRGIGFPSGRFGITYKPNKIVTLGASYRAYSKIQLTGTTTTTLAGLERLNAKADWKLPHAVQFGVAIHLLKGRLMLVIEERLQFHDAKRTGNDSQVVRTKNPDILGTSLEPVLVPFNWRTVHSTKIGVEYSATELVDLRAGFNAAISATREDFAQYFTPPPGFNGFASLGVGLNWTHFDLDLAGAVAFGGKTLGADIARPVSFGGEQFTLCSESQVVRTGCAGEYKVLTFWASVTATYHR